MNRFRVSLAACLVLSASFCAPAVRAQQSEELRTGAFAFAQMERFGNMKRPVAGIIPLRVIVQERGAVSSEWRGAISGRGLLVAVDVDGKPLGAFDKLPHSISLDTTTLSDGLHTVRVSVFDVHTQAEREVDRLTLSVANHPTAAAKPSQNVSRKDTRKTAATAKRASGTPPLIVSATPPPTKANPAATSPARLNTPPPPPRSTARLASRGVRRSTARHAGFIVPLSAAVAPVEALVAPTVTPFSSPASALLRTGKRLIIGLQNGGIVLVEEGAKTGTVVTLPFGSNSVRALAAENGCIWWTSGNDFVYCYDEKRRAVTAYDAENAPDAPTLADDKSGPTAPLTLARALDPNQPGWVARLVPWHGNVLLLGGGTSAGMVRVLARETGTLRDVADELPAPAAAVLQRPGAFVAPGPGDSLMLAALRPALENPVADGAVTDNPAPVLERFEVRGDKCDSCPPISLDAPLFGNEPLFLAPSGVAGVWGTMARTWTTTKKSEEWTTNTVTLGTDGTLDVPLAPQKISLSAQGLWLADDKRVVYNDNETGAASAFLPWGEGLAGAKIHDLVTDDGGAWVATDKGVRRIVPDKADKTRGYDGFVRARLGESEAEPPTAGSVAGLAPLIEEWQGVPYVWGGTTKAGADCSGFIGNIFRQCGVVLPRVSGDIAACKKGSRVVDELHYGDVICYPGHVVIYIGNGKTAEARGGKNKPGSVTKFNIWTRQPTVIRRFWSE